MLNGLLTMTTNWFWELLEYWFPTPPQQQQQHDQENDEQVLISDDLGMSLNGSTAGEIRSTGDHRVREGTSQGRKDLRRSKTGELRRKEVEPVYRAGGDVMENRRDLERRRSEVIRQEKDCKERESHLNKREDKLKKREDYSARKERDLERMDSDLGGRQRHLERKESEFKREREEWSRSRNRKLQEQMSQESIAQAQARHKYEADIAAKDAEIISLRTALQSHIDNQGKLNEMLEREERMRTEYQAQQTNLIRLEANQQSCATELQIARAYLSKIDSVSHGDVVRMTENLNAEIYQVAAQIANEVEDVERHLAHGSLARNALSSTQRCIGPRITDLLQHINDSTFVQIALQACMVEFVGEVIESWDPRHSSIVESIFEEVYTSIQDTEIQSVCGKWRALTRGNLIKRSGQQDLMAAMKPRLVQNLKDVLIVAGLENNSEALLGTYEEKFLAITRMSINIRKAIGEDIVSDDLKIDIPYCEEQYEPDFMEDAYPVGRKQDGVVAGSLILCGVELGVQRLEKSAPAEGNGVEWRGTVILKPKVALQGLIPA